MNGMRQMLDEKFMLDWARRTVKYVAQGGKVNPDELRRARRIVGHERQQRLQAVTA